MAIAAGDADRIRPVKENVEDELIERTGVVAVDIGEKVTGGEPTGQPSIVVYVQKKKAESSLSEAEVIPAEINGVPTDVVEMEIELQTALVRVSDDVEIQLDPGSYRPLRGGISMGPNRSFWLEPPEVPTAGWYRSVGTLGALVNDRATGARMALTNFHVAAVNTGWAVGDVMVQPGHPDGTGVAYGLLARAVLSQNVDGAVVTLDAGIASQGEVVDIGPITGSQAATVGLAVRKRGRTTNLTSGTVGSVDVTVSIDYGDGVGTRTLRHQIRVDRPVGGPRFSDRGDSGSVVVDDDERVVGLLFAGATDGSVTFANPIAAVLDELAVDLWVEPTFPLITRATSTCPDLRTRVVGVCNELRTRVASDCFVIYTRHTIDCFDLRTRVRILCEGLQEPDFPRPPWERPGRPGGGPGPAARYGAEKDLEESFWTGYAAAYEEMQALNDQAPDLRGGE